MHHNRNIGLVFHIEASELVTGKSYMQLGRPTLPASCSKKIDLSDHCREIEFQKNPGTRYGSFQIMSFLTSLGKV